MYPLMLVMRTRAGRLQTAALLLNKGVRKQYELQPTFPTPFNGHTDTVTRDDTGA